MIKDVEKNSIQLKSKSKFKKRWIVSWKKKTIEYTEKLRIYLEKCLIEIVKKSFQIKVKL